MVTAADENCLELRHISIGFGQQKVLKDINLAIGEQEIVSIIGPNGAGKTTLFDIISGGKRPTEGAVLFRGKDITGWPPHRICHAGIARTFQVARPFQGMTALENVLIGTWFGKRKAVISRQMRNEALDLLQLVGIGSKAETPAKELTLSELRRLEVARALGTRPQLLLLDEIAAGLSPQAIQRSVELMRTLRDRGLTLVIIDHFLTLTAGASDRLVAIDKGEIVIEGKPGEVLKCPEVVSAYLGERQPREEGEEDE
jgi:branched-chain amino acid transport system ATP-binding protein